MAQTEDTELRDLVIEALERNGSLAKIRALLRANIFLAFEDEYDNRKQNINLDNILKLPEGRLALSVVHEFLEFCCLKNTLFVYKSESRQRNAYNYDGRKSLNDKLNHLKSDCMKEPILLTIIKNVLKLNNKSSDRNNVNLKDHDRCDDKNYGDEQNCTYILHEDSQSSTNSSTNSNSDNSSDEKNKLQLQLQLDNSDTDTSSEFARDKSSSEYIPGDHILETNNNNPNNNVDTQQSQSNIINSLRSDKGLSVLNSEFKLPNSSSDSTSYIDLMPFNSLDEKMLNTAGLPIVDTNTKNMDITPVQPKMIKHDDQSPPKLATSNSLPLFVSNEIIKVENSDKKSQDSSKSEVETGDFSYGDDFSSSSKSKDTAEVPVDIANNQKGDFQQTPVIVYPKESPKQTSQSSVSLSDVMDLISDKSLLSNINKTTPSISSSKDKVVDKSNKIYSDDSGDFTESPVPSLSNLSLDIHSD